MKQQGTKEGPGLDSSWLVKHLVPNSNWQAVWQCRQNPRCWWALSKPLMDDGINSSLQEKQTCKHSCWGT